MAEDLYLTLGRGGAVTVTDLSAMVDRHRRAHVKARADAVTELSAALAEECFDPETVWDTSVLPLGLKDAAANVAVTLRTIENTGTAQ